MGLPKAVGIFEVEEVGILFPMIFLVIELFITWCDDIEGGV
jgi:hypothetical protein